MTTPRAIPARAGKTLTRLVASSATCGPSPRVRGKRRRPWRALVRTTGHPRACGENCHVGGHSNYRSTGHPRACGENAIHPRLPVVAAWAIPARAGKTEGDAGRLDLVYRAIPARAGKTSKDDLPALLHAGHPRACGENCLESFYLRCLGGPSPRVRGKRSSPAGGWRP